MTIAKHVGFDDYGFADHAFDREPAAINFWRNLLNHHPKLSIGRLRYFFHSYKPFTLDGTVGIPCKPDASLMQAPYSRPAFCLSCGQSMRGMTIASTVSSVSSEGRFCFECGIHCIELNGKL